ncbi:ATP-binding protein [Actinomyces gaoshouyii]|uniref:ATP-binding protein n=1 Tax=Actinomyces gaoshouyii TaxID=1960083 RepID=UPI001F0AFB2C|nr:ATP-binding protein [Actinomyces gaoshouyii]
MSTTSTPSPGSWGIPAAPASVGSSPGRGAAQPLRPGTLLGARAPQVPASSRLPLRRPGRRPVLAPGSGRRSGRWGGGVAAGLGAHLGLDPFVIRLAFILLSVQTGIGPVLYLALWVLVPAGDPWAEAAQSPGALPADRSRLAPRQAPVPAPWPAPGREHWAARAWRSLRGDSGGEGNRALQGAVGLLAAAILLALWRFGLLPRAGTALPALIIATGAGLAWSQLDAVTGAHGTSEPRDRWALARLAAGLVLVATGILMWLASDIPPRAMLTGGLTGGALVLGIATILAPFWLRISRDLAATRTAEARAAERADIAAHLHDSVLQTLTLIRKRADEPETVARLARSQERELRAWLYTDRPEAGTSVADAFRDLAGEIEDLHGVPIDVVCVGDRAPDRVAEVIVAASREALSNAVRHGEPPVSLYVEASADLIEAFIRDHGPGFDPEAAPSDRHGVRESIIARMERYGGTARIRCLDNGTEVRLALPARATQESPS